MVLRSTLTEGRKSGTINSALLQADLGADQRAVSTAEGEAFAEAHGLLFVETSAKQRLNVDAAFVRPAEKVHGLLGTGGVEAGDLSGVKVGPGNRTDGPAGAGGGKGCC